jgi:hypothetical protein
MNPKYSLATALAIVALFCGCEGVLFPLPYRSLAPFEGKVVDAQTKEPIEGVAVLAVYYYETYTVAGSNSIIKDARETVTDKFGEFKLPRARRWFVLNRGYPEGELEICKLGYGTLWHKRSRAVEDNKSCPTPGKYIVYELPKLETIEEIKRQPFHIHSEIPYHQKKNYVREYNRWRKFLGYEPMIFTPEGEE